MTDESKPNWRQRLSHSARDLYRRSLRLLGIQRADAADTIKSLTDLCLAQGSRRARSYQEKALPEALLQAFTVAPLAAGDARFVGRDEPLQRIETVLEHWHAGQSSMIAVTGPQGCGLTSFLQQIESMVPGSDAFRYVALQNRPRDVSASLAILSDIVQLEPPANSVDELLRRLQQLPASVFVIDNGHLLTSRLMGSHDAIRVFGAVMVASQQRHLWILGCEDYAWRRLAYVHQADRYFTHRIELGMLSATELNQCLALRQQMSGVNLNSSMEAGDKTLPDDLENELPTLYRLSNGKPDFAFFYYLGGLQLNPENRRLDMKLRSALDFSALKKLISEELFTLAEVAVHGGMTIDEHCTLFRTSREQSWLLLERLYQQCLLDKHDADEDKHDDDNYRLVPVYSEVICRYLTNANYLY